MPPSFDAMLDTLSEDPSMMDIVGLAGYYLREIEDEHPFSTSQIREIVQPSLRHVPSDSISPNMAHLRDRGRFQRQNDKWNLTREGLDYYGEMVTLDTSTDTPRDDDDLFISATPPENDFYPSLIDDINHSYQHHIYDATMILTRKLLENLLIEVLRLRLGTNDHLETFYIPDQGRFQPFSQLIENFSEELDEFKPYDPDLDAAFISQLNNFRTQANANAHSIHVDINRGEIEAHSEAADALANRLFRLREQARLDAQRDD